MTDPILSLTGVSKAFGAHKVLEQVSFTIKPGEIVGLLGPNGSGKSTLLNLISGFMATDAGEVSLRGTRLSGLPPHKISRHGLVRTFQLPSMPTRMTVREVIEAGASRKVTFGSALKRLVFDDEVETLLDEFKLRPVADLTASSLSGGQKKLLSIATALRTRPSLLCLDEPTAGVHPELRTHMVQLLKQENAKGATILVIEHDMVFIRELCERCIVLDRGQIIADCAPRELENNPKVVEAYLGKAIEKGKVTV